jgi:hypothetical protein
VLALLFSTPHPVSALSPLPVPLGVAANFAVLGGSAISNTGLTTITGDIGSSPTPTITGFPPGIVTGTNHLGDATTVAAKAALVTAYNDAAGRGGTVTIATELGGTSPAPGVYDSAAGTFTITGVLTLTGIATDVWIFKMASTLDTAAGSSVTMGGTALASNVFWQVGSSATLLAGSTFNGNILALTSITLITGSSVSSGRLLARNGAVTLDTNAIVKPASVPVVVVGGEAYPINKANVLLPWLILALIIVIGGSVLVLRRSTSH